MTDNPTNPTYESNFMGVILVVINSFAFLALFVSLMMLHPSIRKRCNQQDRGTSTKVSPMVDVIANGDMDEKSSVRNWGQDDFDVSLLEEDEEEEEEEGKVHHHHHHHHHQHHKHHHKK